mgnify:CR=1 FL=1
MKYIKNVKLEITEEDEEGEYYTDLSAPTIEMALEKLGSFERSRERRDTFDLEKEAEDTAREEIGDVIKSSEVAGEFVNIEK